MRRFFCRAAQRGRRVGLVLVVALLAGLTTVAAGVATAPPASALTTSGYWLVGTDGGIFSFGRAGFFGSTGAIKLNQPIVGMAATPDGLGYWMVASDGGIFAFGNAAFYGSMGGKPLNQPIVGMASTRTGKGYWLVASDGGIFAFGDAPFFGSTGAMRLNKPIVDIVPTPSGRGYWMAASDGGIFAFGDAGFFGSTGAIKLSKRIQQMSATPTGKGYWMVAGDGGIFAFGDAGFFGSAAEGGGAEKRIVDLAPSATGKGYYITGSNGAVYAYGDAKFFGGLDGKPLNHGIISMVALNNGDPPVPADDVISIDEDTFGSVDVLANDRDPDGGPLSIQSVSAPGKGGSATASGSTITYRPAPDMHGTDFFNYTVVDDRGNTAVGRVNVTVRGLDDRPATVDDIVTGVEDKPFGIDVLANDFGLGDGIGTLQIVTQPRLGTATVVGGRILYTPKPNLSGADSLVYRVIDTDGDNAQGNVKITLTAVDDLPVAVDTGMNCSGSTCNADVLSAPGASAGDTDHPQIRLVDEDGNGEVFIDGIGTFARKSSSRIEFKPANNGVTSGQVRYEIGDDNNGAGPIEWSAPATITFHYQNTPPAALAGGEQWASNTPFPPDQPRQLGGNDPDGDPLTFVVESITGPFDPAAPPIQVQPNGSFTFTGGPAGTYVITFRVNDGQSVSEPATYTITVVDPTV